MKTLNESPQLLQQTIDLLNADPAQLNAQAGVNLIDQWVEPLLTLQVTKPISEKLGQLKMLLQAELPNDEAIRTLLNELAEVTQTVSEAPDCQGEASSLSGSLAEKLRQVGKAA